MTQIVFFLEEESAKEMLSGLLPRMLPDDVFPRFVVFEGKQDLEKQIGRKLRAWNSPNCAFMILRDQDSGNCSFIKRNLVQKCNEAGRPKTVVRIACHELESFYLGDLKAVSQAFESMPETVHQHQAKYKNPDRLANPAQELKKLVPAYQKISGSRAIAPFLNLEKNASKSFNSLISGIERMLSDNK